MRFSLRPPWTDQRCSDLTLRLNLTGQPRLQMDLFQGIRRPVHLALQSLTVLASRTAHSIGTCALIFQMRHDPVQPGLIVAHGSQLFQHPFARLPEVVDIALLIALFRLIADLKPYAVGIVEID